MNAHPSSVRAITESLYSEKYNGYGPAVGLAEVR